MNKRILVAGQPVEIDRPEGTRKIFETPSGRMEKQYPVDYGFFVGCINPQDREPCDVFVGSGGREHGRFMKGKVVFGKWSPDEYKWYTRLTTTELILIHDFYESQVSGLLGAYEFFQTEEELYQDVLKHTIHLMR